MDHSECLYGRRRLGAAGRVRDQQRPREVSATVTNTSTVRQQSDASVTVSGVTSSELVPGGSGDSFSVAVAGIESGPEYDLTTVALNGSSAAFNQACSIFTEAEEITKAVTRSYTVYGCIPREHPSGPIST